MIGTLAYIELGIGEGRLVQGGGIVEGEGFFIQPTIIADLDPNARLMQEEVFGPVLGFCKASSFEEALDIANNTEFGLTGAYFHESSPLGACTGEISRW